MPGAFRMTTTICWRCSKEFSLRLSSLKTGKRYCSISCSKRTGNKRAIKKGRPPKLPGTWYERVKNDPVTMQKIRDRNNAYKRTERGRALSSARAAKRRSAQLQATPPWADLEAIKNFFINRPEGMEVDHIIPLQGKTVCGLHVLHNLQYLSQSENCRKSNKLFEGFKMSQKHQES